MAPGERRVAWVATFSALIVVATFVAGKAARDAILLARFDIKTFPIFIGISALLSLPIILVTGKLMTRFGPARLMPALNLLSAAFAVIEWFLLARYPRATSVAVFFHLSTSGAVLVSGFWSIVNERFDVQAAKRHIGRIGMGATLGGILGGLVAEGTAVYLSPDKILLVLAGLQLTCALTLWRFRGEAEPAPEQAPSVGTWFALGVVTRSRLLRNVGLVVLLGAVSACILDYVFKADIVAGASGSLLGSLAMFYTVTNVLAAAVQVVLCGPLIARLGVPRSVGTLPVTVTLFGIVALAIPAALAAAIARGAEMVTRNSIYRAGYELLYTPLPEVDKRPTKIVLDVGAERIGDLLGAQVVGAIVYLVVEPRLALLIATVAIGVVTMFFASRLPRSYTLALEESLLAHGAEPPGPIPARAWRTLTGIPVLGQAGDLAPLSMREKRPRRPPVAPDAINTTLADLRCTDVERVKRALGTSLTPELAIHAIKLLGRDDVGREALVALRGIAPRCTGMMVDALRDPAYDVAIRKRLPEVLLAGEPALAAWGLWRGLGDASFEVRYRCGAVLARLGAAGHLGTITPAEVFETVRRELVGDPDERKQRRVLDDLVVRSALDARDLADELAPARHTSGGALEYVFSVLGLVLPAEPLRIALRAVQTDDLELRGTALEYLESILPADVRAQLWPLLEAEGATPAEPAHLARTPDQIVAALNEAAFLEKLQQRVKRA